MHHRRATALFALAFILLAAGDLASTLLGQQVGAREFNPVVAQGAALDVERFLIVNLILGAMLVVMFGWALARRDRADPAYMAQPWRAALSWMTYVNPFAARNQPRAVFHWPAIAVSLLLVRTVVIGNNLLIAHQLPDLLTPLARMAAVHLAGTLLYLATASLLIAPFWLASLYATRRLLLLQPPRQPMTMLPPGEAFGKGIAQHAD